MLGDGDAMKNNTPWWLWHVHNVVIGSVVVGLACAYATVFVAAAAGALLGASIVMALSHWDLRRYAAREGIDLDAPGDEQ